MNRVPSVRDFWFSPVDRKYFKGATLDEVPTAGAGLKINGSVLLALAESKEDVIKCLQDDVYYKNNVWDWERVKIYPVCFHVLCWISCTLLIAIKVQIRFQRADVSHSGHKLYVNADPEMA